MENLWIEIAKQVPSLVVLGWLVVYFLRHMERMVDQFGKMTTDWAKSVEGVNHEAQTFQTQLHTEHRAMFSKLGGALDKNTEALGKNSATLDRAMKLLGES